MTYLPSSTTSSLNAIQVQLLELRQLLSRYKTGFLGISQHPGYQDRWMFDNLFVGSNSFISNASINEWGHSWMQNLVTEANVLRHYWTATSTESDILVKYPIDRSITYRQFFVRDEEENEVVNISVNGKSLLTNFSVSSMLNTNSFGFKDFFIPKSEGQSVLSLTYGSANDQPVKMHAFQLFPSD